MAKGKTNTTVKDWIIYEDEHTIAINKPSGLLSIPDREGKEDSLKTLLDKHYGKVYTVHRLDRDTSGLILFAKNEAAHHHYNTQFQERQTEKIYLGLLVGNPANPQGTVNASIAENKAKAGTMMVHTNGKDALTDYAVIKRFKFFSWVQFQIYTGRTHQIRVHAKEIGHPIVGDKIYGDGKNIYLSSLKNKFKLNKQELEERPLLSRLALHSSRLGITDMQQDRLELEAPLQKDLQVALTQLRKVNRAV